MMRAFAVLVLLLLADLASGCGCACGAACAQPGVRVVLKGVSADEIAAFATDGVCGPAHGPLCQDSQNSFPCDAGTEKTRGWQLLLPASGTGTCSVDITLVDGGRLDGSVTATQTTGSCCPGTYGDSTLVLIAPGFDAGNICPNPGGNVCSRDGDCCPGQSCQFVRDGGIGSCI